MIPLYPSDTEIARELFGTGKDALASWKAAAAIWSRHGLPNADPFTGRRYWPAVRAFLDRRAGLRDDQPVAMDGRETFDVDAPRPRRQAQATR